MDLSERHDLSRWLAVQLLIAVAQSFVLGVLVLWALLTFGRTVNIGDCWAVSLVAVTAIRLQRMALPATGSRRRRRMEAAESSDAWLSGPGKSVLGRPAQEPAAPLPETLDRRFRRLARHGDRLTYAVVETRHYDSGVRPVLTEIAADRLRRHHGIDMAAEPQRAQNAMGDELWQALMRDRPGPPTAADLDRWLTALEDLGSGPSALTDRLLPELSPHPRQDQTAVPDLTPREAGALATQVLDAVERAVVGKREALELVLAGMIAGGHILLEDVPGLGKTLLARSFAQVLGLDFRRVQFTPDLLPADITGSFVVDSQGEFVFRAGPIFANLLLGDEINRTPPKTQAALLESMQEHQVSVEGVTYPLPQPFIVLATANPIEHEGTYPLPEAQLDRFLLRVSLGYPSADAEWEVLVRRLRRQREDQVLDPVSDRAGVLALQRAVERVAVEESIGRYCVLLVRATREHRTVMVGASPRGALALMQIARARALLQGRDYVVPEDVKSVVVPALAHRLVLEPETWLRRVTPAHVLTEILGDVAAPQSGLRPTYVDAPT